MKSISTLLQWYRQMQRPLPWRVCRDPYRIWISETMLQQTTTTAVIPFYERFLTRFPDLEALAKASEAEVKKEWAGLGYYSRATNLWNAAKILHARGSFPRSYNELLDLPGFGPYTARAVSSLAFGESVGVLDGNVIRVLCRYLNRSVEWWKPKVRQDLQRIVDSWVVGQPSHEVNQALMELGATICTPRSPTCLLCPLQSGCAGLKARTLAALPLAKPRRKREFWLWQVDLYQKGQRIALLEHHSLPFLRRHWVLPGTASQLTRKPSQFDFSHSITHHDIFVSVRRHKGAPPAQLKDWQWIKVDELASFAPASLVRKALVVPQH